MTTMLRQLCALLLSFALAVGPCAAAVGSWNGVAFTAWNGVAQTSWNGTAISCASGGGGFVLVNHLEYSPNGGSLTSGALDCTGATLIVVFVGTYVDWYATSFTDSNGNTYTAATKYSATTQAGQFWYVRNPTGTLSALTFTATTVASLSLYTYYGIMAFSGGATSTLDQQNGDGGDSTDPLQPGSITPSQDNALVVSGIYDYAAGAAPTCSAMTAAYGVAKSGNIGMGGSGYVVQGTAAAINPTWVSSGAAGTQNAVVIASFIP